MHMLGSLGMSGAMVRLPLLPLEPDHGLIASLRACLRDLSLPDPKES
jgi:hypothetical protein